MLHMQIIILSFKSAVEFVLLGSVATELRWGGRHNNRLLLRAMNFLL